MKNNDYPNIEELVPHRKKALLVKEIIGFDQKEKTVTVRIEIKSDDIVEGHFPEPLPKLYRGVDLVECGAIGGIALAKMLNPELSKNSMPLFKKIIEVDFFELVTLGDIITMTIRLDRYRLKAYFFSFEAMNQDGIKVISGKIMGMLVVLQSSRENLENKLERLIAEKEGISPQEVTTEYIHMRRMEVNPELYGELGEKEIKEIKEKTSFEKNIERAIMGM